MERSWDPLGLSTGLQYLPLWNTLVTAHLRKGLSQENGGQGDQEAEPHWARGHAEGRLRQVSTGYWQSPAKDIGVHGQGVSRLLAPQTREVPG